jgi:hypothetical protein
MKRRARDLVKSLGNRPAVPRLESQCLEDQQFQRALRELNVVAQASPFPLRQESLTHSLVEVQGVNRPAGFESPSFRRASTKLTALSPGLPPRPVTRQTPFVPISVIDSDVTGLVLRIPIQ